MKKKNVTLGLLVLFAVLVMLPIKAEAGWQLENGQYYHYNSAGMLSTNKKIGQYYVGKNGARYINRWKGKNFYGEDGKRIPNFKGGWQTIEGKRYYYTPEGKKVTGWLKLKGKKYYLDENGVMLLKWKVINGNYYYFSTGRKQYGAALKGWQKLNRKRFYLSEKNGKLKLGWFSVGNKKYYATTGEGVYTGIRDIDGQSYLFNSPSGALLKGWRTYQGNKYYCTRKTGALAKGMGSIGGRLYYFDEAGVMQKSKVVTVDNVAYSINANGICTKIASSSGTPDDMLFFTLYESGIEGYGQVGGDNGNACGKYQFDRRYSLIPLVKYCYGKDPVVFKAFEPYAKWSNTSKYQTKLLNNQQFYKAWTSIYETYPFVFKNYQDAFAMQEYYSPVERQLQAWGIDISNRPYVVRGTVFSYSIQHGAGTAAMAVRDAKIKNTTTNEDFIKKLYKYRISKFPTYKSRYTREMNDALGRL